MTDTARNRSVRVLQFKRLRRGVTALDRKIESGKLLSELERLELNVQNMKCRVFQNGRVIMYYNDREGEPTIKIGKQEYGGSVVFLHIDANTLLDLTAQQIRAIRGAVRRL